MPAFETSSLTPKERVLRIVQSLTDYVEARGDTSEFNRSDSDKHQISVGLAKARIQATLIRQKLSAGINTINNIANRIYVGNLYYELQESDLREAFHPFGKISSIHLSLEPGTIRSKGFGFIDYDEPLAAESAVQVLNMSTLGERAIKVGRPKQGVPIYHDEKGKELTIGEHATKNIKTSHIYVANIVVEITDLQIQMVFAPFGKIKSCIMMPSKHPNMHRGYGFIEFETVSAAETAIKHMNKFNLAGQEIHVGKASPYHYPCNLQSYVEQVVEKVASSIEDNDIQSWLKKHQIVKDSMENRCIIIKEMIFKEEVDEDFIPEVMEECKAYGTPVDIYLTQHEQVSVYVLFQTSVEAEKAKNGFHGRYFAGKKLEVEFYC